MLYNSMMNDISSKLKSLAESKFEQSVAIKTLEERIDQELYVPINGGLFKATPQLISFLAAWSDDVVYLKDEYAKPVKLETGPALAKLQAVYRFAMNAWHTEYNELTTVRKITNV